LKYLKNAGWVIDESSEGYLEVKQVEELMKKIKYWREI